MHAPHATHNEVALGKPRRVELRIDDWLRTDWIVEQQEFTGGSWVTVALGPVSTFRSSSYKTQGRNSDDATLAGKEGEGEKEGGRKEKEGEEETKREKG
eukprot:Skav212470  [mRNA]  locus=scaffold385:339211:342954:- [translate_table: standard]